MFHLRSPGKGRNRERKGRAFGIGLAWAGLCLLALPLLAGEDAASVRLTLLHTNDMHGRLLPQRLGKKKVPTGGIARVAGYAAKVRKALEAEGGKAVLLDAGDAYAGTPEGKIPKGRLCIEMMNAAGYTAACIGNHEFDDGIENLEALAALATFPLLAANMVVKGKGTPPPWVKPYLLLDVGGVKVAILGAVTVDTDMISGGADTVLFMNEEASLRRAARQAKKEGALLCIALTHIGFDRDRELSYALPEISILIGGHSHTYLRKGWKNARTGVWVLQAGCHATHVGRVDLVLSRATGKILSLSASLVSLKGEDVPEDPGVKALLEKKSEAIRKAMDSPIGEVAHRLDRSGRRYSGVSTPLGNLLADLMREAGKADIAFHNRTGIREILPEGPVTLRDVYKVCPFGNTVFTMDLTGKDILALLEYSHSKGNRFLLEVSGAKVVYDPAREVGQRVISVEGGGKPLDPDATYRVATSNFIAAGGDGHEIFPKGKNRKDTGILTRDRLAEKIRSSSPLRVEYEKRLIKS
ncbi:MAG: bifunctional metallophosphatase/5'-nucleotidase [Planctomycetota bacterium]